MEPRRILITNCLQCRISLTRLEQKTWCSDYCKAMYGKKKRYWDSRRENYLNKSVPVHKRKKHKKKNKRSKSVSIALENVRLKTELYQLKKSSNSAPPIPRQKHPFYDSQEWRELRYRVIKFYGRQCMLCHTKDGEIHVDHIKPRSKYPHLELVFDNLQVLCKDCNLGKQNYDEIDYRPHKRV